VNRFGDTPADVVAAWGTWYDRVMRRHERGDCRDGNGYPVLSCSIQFLSPRGQERVRVEMDRIRLNLYLRTDCLTRLPDYDEPWARDQLTDAIGHLTVSRGLKSEMATRREAAGRLVSEDLPSDAKRLFEGLGAMRHADG